MAHSADPIPEDFTDEEGQRIGKYEVEGLLGEGGMGMVYLALNRDLDRRVALKVMRPEYGRNERMRLRFEREVRVLSRLNHPNILYALDAGQSEGNPYLVTDFVDGMDVRSLLLWQSRLEPGLACEIVRQAAIGVAEAHTNGIVHRDLKPSNLLLGRDGRVRVADFGLAKPDDAMTRLSLGTTGVLQGTPDFMSPEQADGLKVTGKSDVYSLGVCLYQMLSGRLPFGEVNGVVAKAMAQVNDTPARLAELAPDLPKKLASFVDALLVKEPTERLAMPELAEALSAWAVTGTVKEATADWGRHTTDVERGEGQATHPALAIGPLGISTASGRDSTTQGNRAERKSSVGSRLATTLKNPTVLGVSAVGMSGVVVLAILFATGFFPRSGTASAGPTGLLETVPRIEGANPFRGLVALEKPGTLLMQTRGNLVVALGTNENMEAFTLELEMERNPWNGQFGFFFGAKRDKNGGFEENTKVNMVYFMPEVTGDGLWVEHSIATVKNADRQNETVVDRDRPLQRKSVQPGTLMTVRTLKVQRSAEGPMRFWYDEEELSMDDLGAGEKHWKVPFDGVFGITLRIGSLWVRDVSLTFPPADHSISEPTTPQKEINEK